MMKIFYTEIIVISKLLKRYLKAKRTRLFMSAATNLRGVFRESGQEKLRVDFQRARGDRVAVKVCVVQMARVNDQMDQCRSV